MKVFCVYLIVLMITLASLPPHVASAAPIAQAAEIGAWPMVAANPQRTSWTPEQVTGPLAVEWYLPIEAYIPQNVQIIAANGLLYIATSGGLYALDAATGATVWRYDTALPLGNSPTVDGNVLYVGGYDRKLHALNALTGSYLWAYSGAKAGFSTNPLVVDGRVIAGNRDGSLYAVGAHGTAQQGQLLWRFDAGGPILQSSAYEDGVVYFAADDNYGYAVNATSGALVWKSDKLPSGGFHSHWAMVYGEHVVLTGAPAYRTSSPGLASLVDPQGAPYGKYHDLERDDLFPGAVDGTQMGPQVANQSWANGRTVYDYSRVSEYQEQNPNPDPNVHKPWRRLIYVLARSNGTEYTFDSDSDGYRETIPVVMWGTQSGTRYPPVVGSDGMLYQNNLWQKFSIPQGQVMGWRMGTPYMVPVGGRGAVDEPQALSAGGSVIYRNLCCDRIGDYFGIGDQHATGTLWTYNSPLEQQAPGYDAMWTVLPGYPRLQGWYRGTTTSVNAAYHNHGDQNPIIPYRGRLYVHRSNAIIAYGPSSGPGRLPSLTINPVSSSSTPLTQADLVSRLSVEVRKILDAGNLRSGYYQASQVLTRGFEDMFDNPGDTLYTLARAYPFLSPELQDEVRNYLRTTFQSYFDPAMYTTVGWSGGARESWMIPPDVEAAMSSMGPSTRRPRGFTFAYPQQNFYALWKYAEIVPADAGRAYALAKSKLQLPLPTAPVEDYYLQQPYELNAYITGYMGFLGLQEAAGMAQTDSALAAQVNTELQRILQMRVDNFRKDSYWTTSGYHKKHFDLARNFMFMVPELAEYLYARIPSQLTSAIAEYTYIAPYWFVSQYESTLGEGVMSILYNYYALFQAKALILQEPGAALTRYIDVPAFPRGDLFYIQNLTAALENYDLAAPGPNNNPIAEQDTTSVEANTPISIDVLANDHDQDDDALAIVGVGAPNNGTATINTTATAITYRSNPDFSGTDSFTYLITDGHGGWASGTVNVLVSTSQMRGDVSCDAAVNSVDALFSLQYGVGFKQPSDQCPLPDNTLLLPTCDVNEDTACNTVDSLFILQCSTGLPNAFCPLGALAVDGRNLQAQTPTVANHVAVMVHSVNAPSGKTVTIPITADVPDGGMGAVTIDIQYDPRLLQLLGCIPDPDQGFDSALCNSAYATDPGETAVARLNLISASGFGGSSVVAHLSFQVIGVAGQTTVIEALPSGWTTQGELMSVSTQNAEVQFTADLVAAVNLFVPLAAR